MSHADLADEPDIAVTARTPPWSHTLRVAVGWAVAAALCAAVTWITATATVREVFKTPLHVAPEDEMVVLAAISGGGLLVGSLAGFLLGRRRGLDSRLRTAAVVGVAGAIMVAVGTGLSKPLSTAGDPLRPEIGSAIAWAVAGAFAGLVGGIGRRFWREHDEQMTDESASEVVHTAGWSVAGALCAGIAWTTAMLVARYVVGSPILNAPEGVSLVTDIELTMIGGGCGLVVGTLAGSLLIRRQDFGNRPLSATLVGLGGGLCGAVGGGLSTPMIAAFQQLPPEVSSGLAWAVAGLLAGFLGRIVTRKPTPSDAEVEEETEKQIATAAPRQPVELPMLRLLPVLAVAVLTFVAAMTPFPPGTRMILITIGLLGLAVAYVQAGQERRIRELERRLRQRPPDRSPDDTVTLTPQP